jgi:outer membrane protein assembly factor BamB
MSPSVFSGQTFGAAAMRYLLGIAGCGAILATAGQLWAGAADEIISEAAAQRCGLTRAWVTQAQVDAGRSRLQSLVLYDGMLFAQSSRATLEAIDAETGQRLWSKLIGQPSYPSLPPGASKDLVATINGSRFYVLNRYTGDILYQTNVDGVPGGGPALSTKRAYVPTANGMVYSYRLEPVTDAAKELGKIDPGAATMTDDQKKDAAKQAEEDRRENLRLHQEYVPPLACASDGRALVPPVVTTQTRDEEFVTWVTDKGHLHLGRVDRRSPDSLMIRFRVNAKGSFNSSPAYMPRDGKVGSAGVIFAGSSEGEVFAISERDGEPRWKFSIGDPIGDSPILIGDRLFVTSELGGLFAINAKSGKQIWYSPDILHFLAAGRQRVYASDKLGRLRILDGGTGTMLDMLPTGGLPVKVSNGQTDRIYLATETGLVQCLHEVEETKPIVYSQVQAPVEAEEPAKLPALKAKSGEGGAAKPKAPKKPAPKKDGTGGFDDAVPGADAAKPAKKPPRGGRLPKGKDAGPDALPGS